MVQIVQPRKKSVVSSPNDIYANLRIELLESIREDIALSHWDECERAAALYWVDLAIAAALHDRVDWIVEFHLRFAAIALPNRHQAKVRCEIEFAILEFHPMRVVESCGEQKRRH